jgi:hypothetical protein
MELTTINGDKVTIEENSGESHDEAIVILAKDEKDGTMAEYYYLAKKHGERGKDWELDRQTLEESPDKKRHYDRMDISLKDGTKKRYYFDITEFFESGESHPSSIEKMSRLELLEFLSELFENTKELQKKSGSDKDIELNKRLEARIKSKLSEKGIPEGKIKNALRILEVGKEKMADERKIAEKEGCSEEEVKARLVKIAKIMGKMLDEDESMKSALPVSSLEARDKFFDENKE